MIAKDFYKHLELKITHALQQSANPEWRKYWCDGITVPDASNLLSNPSSDSIGNITTSAVIPKGQYEEEKYRYQLTIWLGDLAHQRINNRESLNDCVPDSPADEWISLDTANQMIDVQLL